MRRFSMLEVISILGLPMPRNGHSSYNISCPYCDTKPKQKHLNINLKKRFTDAQNVANTAVFLIYTHCFRACREIRFLMTL